MIKNSLHLLTLSLVAYFLAAYVFLFPIFRHLDRWQYERDRNTMEQALVQLHHKQVRSLWREQLTAFEWCSMVPETKYGKLVPPALAAYSSKNLIPSYAEVSVGSGCVALPEVDDDGKY